MISQDSSTLLPIVKCSRCGQELKYLGDLLEEKKRQGRVVSLGGTDQSLLGWQAWDGTVCPACGMVFCPDCQESHRETT